MKLLKLVPDNTNIHFLRWQWPFFISNILLMIGAVVLLFTHGLNLGVDFVGGQMIRATFVENPAAPVAELREKVGSLGYGEPIIQQFGKPNEVSIRMKLPDGAEEHAELADAMANKITATLKQTYPGAAARPCRRPPYRRRNRDRSASAHGRRHHGRCPAPADSPTGPACG